MSRWFRHAFLLLTLVGGVALAGCGGSSDGGGLSTIATGAGASHSGSTTGAASRAGSSAGGTGKTAPLTRQSFIRAADTVCKRAHARLGVIGRRLGQTLEAASHRRIKAAVYRARAGALAAQSAVVARAAVQQLKALGPPSDRRVREYLALTTTEAALLGQQAVALRKGDSRTVRAINDRLRGLGRRAIQAARGYGFHECGGGGGGG